MNAAPLLSRIRKHDDNSVATNCSQIKTGSISRSAWMEHFRFQVSSFRLGGGGRELDARHGVNNTTR
jgi:hypothetical protein